jgi:Tfp pilus assembly protein PilX
MKKSLPAGRQGFALLIAVIFMSVMLSLGLALGSLGYKQQVLASGAIESQYAFYAADAALECALYADQQQNLFAYNSNLAAPAPSMICDNAAPVSTTVISHTTSQWVISTRLSFDSNKHCADITIYKYSAQQSNGITSYLFSQGYDVSCSTVASPNGARFVSRGISSYY